jgi:chaperone modulatory protein CbpM
MMVTLERLRLEIRGLDEAELERWIGASLVRAEGAAGARLFEEIDVARIRLIYELRHELDIEEPALPVVLSLMDQLYDLRRRGAQLNAALADLPADVRQAILRRLG